MFTNDKIANAGVAINSVGATPLDADQPQQSEEAGCGSEENSGPGRSVWQTDGSGSASGGNTSRRKVSDRLSQFVEFFERQGGAGNLSTTFSFRKPSAPTRSQPRRKLQRSVTSVATESIEGKKSKVFQIIRELYPNEQVLTGSRSLIYNTSVDQRPLISRANTVRGPDDYQSSCEVNTSPVEQAVENLEPWVAVDQTNGPRTNEDEHVDERLLECSSLCESQVVSSCQEETEEKNLVTEEVVANKENNAKYNEVAESSFDSTQKAPRVHSTHSNGEQSMKTSDTDNMTLANTYGQTTLSNDHQVCNAIKKEIAHEAEETTAQMKELDSERVAALTSNIIKYNLKNNIKDNIKDNIEDNIRGNIDDSIEDYSPMLRVTRPTEPDLKSLDHEDEIIKWNRELIGQSFSDQEESSTVKEQLAVLYRSDDESCRESFLSGSSKQSRQRKRRTKELMMDDGASRESRPTTNVPDIIMAHTPTLFCGRPSGWMTSPEVWCESGYKSVDSIGRQHFQHDFAECSKNSNNGNRSTKRVSVDSNAVKKASHFVAIRIDSPYIVRKVQTFQNKLIKEYPLLTECRANPEKLHLTLLVLSLLEDDKDKACAALQMGVKRFSRLWENLPAGNGMDGPIASIGRPAAAAVPPPSFSQSPSPYYSPSPETVNTRYSQPFPPKSSPVGRRPAAASDATTRRQLALEFRNVGAFGLDLLFIAPSVKQSLLLKCLHVELAKAFSQYGITIVGAGGGWNQATEIQQRLLENRVHQQSNLNNCINSQPMKLPRFPQERMGFGSPGYNLTRDSQDDTPLSEGASLDGLGELSMVNRNLSNERLTKNRMSVLTDASNTSGWQLNHVYRPPRLDSMPYYNENDPRAVQCGRFGGHQLSKPPFGYRHSQPLQCEIHSLSVNGPPPSTPTNQKRWNKGNFVPLQHERRRLYPLDKALLKEYDQSSNKGTTYIPQVTIFKVTRVNRKGKKKKSPETGTGNNGIKNPKPRSIQLLPRMYHPYVQAALTEGVEAAVKFDRRQKQRNLNLATVEKAVEHSNKSTASPGSTGAGSLITYNDSFPPLNSGQSSGPSNTLLGSPNKSLLNMNQRAQMQSGFGGVNAKGLNSDFDQTEDNRLEVVTTSQMVEPPFGVQHCVKLDLLEMSQVDTDHYYKRICSVLLNEDATII